MGMGFLAPEGTIVCLKPEFVLRGAEIPVAIKLRTQFRRNGMVSANGMRS